MVWIRKRNAHAPFSHPPQPLLISPPPPPQPLLISQALILVYPGTASQVKVQAISVALIPLTPTYG